MSTGSSSEIRADSQNTNARSISLLHLPPEILWDVTSYIKPDGLASLVRVCKRTREICIPRLYEVIVLSPADLTNPNTLLRDGNINIRHVRSVQVIGDMEEAGFWPVDLSDSAIERVLYDLRRPLDKFLSYLGKDTLREFVWRTDLALGKRTADYLLQHQKKIQKLTLCRLSLPSTLFFNGSPEDGNSDSGFLDFSTSLLNKDGLVWLDVRDVSSFEGLQYLLKAIVRNQNTLKRLRFGFPSYEAHKMAHNPPGINNWSTKSIEDAIAACGVNLESTTQTMFPALRSIEVSDFGVSADESQEAMILINGAIKLRQVQSLKFRNCGYLDSTIWPLIASPLQISVLHLTIYRDFEVFYDFLEKQNSITTLSELRLVIRVRTAQCRFPDVRRHAQTLRVLYLAMVHNYDDLPRAAATGMIYMYPTPMATIHQIMSLPRLQELAIPFQNPNISRIKLDESSFPSLRVLWILSANGLIEPRQHRGGFFDLISMAPTPSLIETAKTRKDHLDKIFGKASYYPNKLEIIGMGLKENYEHPEDILLIPKVLPHGYKLRPETELQGFDRARKAVTALVPVSLSREEYSWIKIFELGKGNWGHRAWA
ncbi:hypothetical protein AOL_s00076g447 [Orbilia oligospora ATCC 24927]|uniref:F-box domain-containing protein n=2 Tax=Orbilia oligospora TaxID=2813651 RepID=G1X9V8_ARTOA|nr:hypothetical protein AOL_s00076g447 [Orbilia oligospora ATCC 24927]EGX50096.1 hypothetical protein AOL_s00076g447 [Orbilia oligospora ATCC 24927]KAF3275866.1 hypothetical protein TWF970_006478 [Orbilia oligospora]